MSAAWIIAAHTFRECRRRRVFLIVPVAAVAFVGLFTLGAHYAFRQTTGTLQMGQGLVDARALVG
ncbi:MAG: hypothetical protein ABR575_04280, partial [Actinomycetota bacterium]